MVVDNDDDMLEDGRHGVKREEGRGGGSPADDNTNTNTNNTSSSSSSSSKNAKGKKSVPVCVMLPLDLINPDSGRFLDETKEKLSIQLEKLRSANVSSVMIDVWWGIVENEAPGKYNWGGYKSLIELIIKSGLKIHAVMSFHSCGENPGDGDFTVNLPQWVCDYAQRVDENIFYCDSKGTRCKEYISLFADETHIGTPLGFHHEIRMFHDATMTPLDAYENFMRSFANTFREYILSGSILEIIVGLGPCGELRYPSYSTSTSNWKYPGIGTLQCYDERARMSLALHASKSGVPKWGDPPKNLEVLIKVGENYKNETSADDLVNAKPNETQFWTNDESTLKKRDFDDHEQWDSAYGWFFLSWYSKELSLHAERVLTRARKALEHVLKPIGDNPLVDGKKPKRISYETLRYEVDVDDDDDGVDGDNDNNTNQQNRIEGGQKQEQYRAELSMKLAGVHWWANTRSRAAECISGMHCSSRTSRNPRAGVGYEDIVKICAMLDVNLTFTCCEMKDNESNEARSRNLHSPTKPVPALNTGENDELEDGSAPEYLLKHVSSLCSLYGVQLEGENALSRVDQEAYETITKHCKGGYAVEIIREDEDGSLTGEVSKVYVPAMKSFTYLRLHDELITDEDNFERFKRFVENMSMI
jgi:beta-amylase